ncbi:MAG: hypothetical protein AAFX99_29680 [Myxococcota bacterium]
MSVTSSLQPQDVWGVGDTVELRASPFLSAEGLPTKPAPTLSGAPVVWVELLDEGKLFYKGREIDIDRSELERQVQVYHEMRSWGYLPPVLSEHQKDGERDGHLLDVRTWDHPDGRRVLIGAVQLNVPDAQSKLDNQQIYYFSPGLGPVEDPKTGKVYPLATREVSRVSAPHRKTKAHVLGAEQQSSPTKGGDMDHAKEEGSPEQYSMGEKIMEKLAAMEARMNAMESSVKSMMEGGHKPHDGQEADMGEPAPAPEAPASVEASEGQSAVILELQEQLAQLKHERNVATMGVFLGKRQGYAIDLSEADAEAWTTIQAKAPEAFAALKDRARKLSTEPKAPAATGPVDPWGSLPLGESDTPAPEAAPEAYTREQVKAMAEKTGRNFFDLLAELRESGAEVNL